MTNTVTNDLAAEVEALRELVLDLGEQVTALTAGHGTLMSRSRALFEVMRRTADAEGMPETTAPLDEADGRAPAPRCPTVAVPWPRRHGHLTSLPGGAR
jgi:hypothetical protein